ncbi:uncharacterized protein LOC144568416 [Carex rostrata]
MDRLIEETCAISGNKGKGRAKKKDGNTKSREREPNWSDRETNMLLDLLDEVQSRRQDPNSDGGYNDQEWSYVYNEFTKNNTQKRALPSLKLRWKNLKYDFSFFRYMANRSGCTWNEDTHMPDVPEDAWIDLKEKDPNRHKKYFNKTFPWYNRVETLYGKSIASGSSNITTAPNCPIPRTFADISSSDDDNATTQQQIDDFSNPEFQMMADSVEVVPEPVYESVDPTPNVPISEPVDPMPNEPVYEPIHIPSSQNRKRGNNSTDKSSRRTKLKQGVNRMDEFAERFLCQQKERTELIAQLGQANQVHDQVLNKLESLALPTTVHVDMEMSLANSWVRGCFIKEVDNERLMAIVDRAVGLFRSGQLPLNS